MQRRVEEKVGGTGTELEDPHLQNRGREQQVQETIVASGRGWMENIVRDPAREE